MKKSSVVLLTIIAALTISSCAVQTATENLGPPDPMYAEQVSDTSKHYLSDTTQVQNPQSNYYYRSYFWDDMYRLFFPRKYYQAINKPEYTPRHARTARHDLAGGGRGRAHSSHSSRRGGFGHHGITHTPIS